MDVFVSPLSIVSNQLMSFIKKYLATEKTTDATDTTVDVDVSVGAPALVANNEESHQVNLFFYRFEPSGLQANSHPNDPWRLRILCLLTVFCSSDEDGASAGEKELGILGNVLRLFHENPVLEVADIGGETISLQLVFIPASDDQINQIWATQHDAIYRPSVIYEISLVPVIPITPRTAPPLVGEIGTQIGANVAPHHAQSLVKIHGIPQRPVAIDINNPLWAPGLCWVHNGECVQAISVGIDKNENLTLSVLLAGNKDALVQLNWQRWDKKEGWVDIHLPAGPTEVTPGGAEIHPKLLLDSSNLSTVELVIDFMQGEDAAQVQLHASRVVNTPEQGQLPIRSTPILLSLYRKPEQAQEGS